jgi:hypothetical protein
MNSNTISRIILLIVGIMLAVMMGNLVVSDKLSTFILFAGAAALITGIALGRNIWIILVLGHGLQLSLYVPGRPDTVLLSSAIFLGFASLMVLMRRIPWRGTIREMDILIFLIALTILQVYLRNPVGMNIFGGDSVGARPYFAIIISFAIYYFLSNWVIPPHQLKLLLKLTVMANLINFGLQIIGFFIPSVGQWYGAAAVNQNANNMDVNAVEGTQTTGLEAATRIGFLGSASNHIARFVSSFRSPLTALLHPLWGGAILISFAFAAMSGFRNAIISLGFTYIVGIAYRNGFAGLVVATTLVALGLGTISITNSIHPLPANIQRSFSFLPGTWDEDIKQSAEGSTEWRVLIWKEVMLTDRWIKNKYFGDGLGFSAQELAIQMDIKYRSMSGQKISATGSGFDSHRDAILANGDYHSGPIQTIRVVGYLGLAILMLTQFRLAVHAHRQIKRCRNTEWYPLALFVGIPLIWSPIFFVFVFGSFEIACSIVFLGAAWVKILENHLPLEPYRKLAPPLPYVNPSRASRSAHSP